MGRVDTLVEDLCREIDYLEQELEKYKKDAEYWRNAHGDLVDRDIGHSTQMTSSMLKMLLTPGVSEAFVANANPEDFAGDQA